MLLFLGIPRKDTKPLAKGLINQFGSLSAAIEADRRELAAAGLPQAAVAALDMVVEAAGILAQPDAINRKVIADLPALERHALDQHATAAILLRNAGPAAAKITAADRALHTEVHRAGAKLSVVVHDLVVMGRGQWLSLRQRGH